MVLYIIDDDSGGGGDGDTRNTWSVLALISS